MKPDPSPIPPRSLLYTVMSEIVGWRLGRTADIPKSQRFTFGRRLDNLALDGFQSMLKSVFPSESLGPQSQPQL